MKIRLSRRIVLLAFSLVSVFAGVAQQGYRMTHYDEYDGLAHREVIYVLQGMDGYLWIATWNGLDRFDGYEFVNFKSYSPDSDPLPSGRILNLKHDGQGNLVCRVENDAFLFDTKKYVFKKIGDKSIVDSLQGNIHPKGIDYEKAGIANSKPNKVLARLEDEGGNLWMSSRNGLYKLTPYTKHNKQALYDGNSCVRAFMLDDDNRLWVSLRDENAIMVVSADGKEKLYLSKSGVLSPQRQAFGSSAYALLQGSDGTVWMGCKPDGLFRLTKRNGGYNIEHIDSVGIVFDIKEDQLGRIWVATYDQDLKCVYNKDGATVVADPANGLSKYPTNRVSSLRNILITPEQEMLIASTSGLLVADVNKEDLGEIEFKVHQSEANRPESLSSNATMSIFRDSQGKIYVCTESGGINLLESGNVLDDELSFKRINKLNGLQSDIALSMIEANGNLWVVSNNGLIKIENESSYLFDTRYFNDDDSRFSEALPQRLPDGNYALGLNRGVAILDLDSIGRDDFVPKMAISEVLIQDPQSRSFYNVGDTIVLNPGERNVTVNFVALDFKEPRNIEYAFSFDKGQWSYIGHNRSATFLDLAPGKHKLSIKSTNSGGVWVDNARTYVIDVVPTIWESTFMQVIYTLLIFAAFGAIVWLILYIHRIRKRKETLEAYLSLINLKQEEKDEDPEEAEAVVETEEMALLEQAQVKAADDKFIKRIVNFVTEHLDDPEINIEDMASAAATSKAGLNRKMKSILGITPYAFVREVRLQEAARRLAQTSMSISEIAIACGFSDQRYFSKIFKQKYGLIPTEYRHQSNQ